MTKAFLHCLTYSLMTYSLYGSYIMKLAPFASRSWNWPHLLQDLDVISPQLASFCYHWFIPRWSDVHLRVGILYLTFYALWCWILRILSFFLWLISLHALPLLSEVGGNVMLVLASVPIWNNTLRHVGAHSILQVITECDEEHELNERMKLIWSEFLTLSMCCLYSYNLTDAITLYIWSVMDLIQLLVMIGKLKSISHVC